MKKNILLFVSLVVIFSNFSCTEGVKVEDVITEGPYFPRLLPNSQEQDHMEALLIGELIFEDNCFQVKDQETGLHLTPIWPAGYDYRSLLDSTLIILNSAGNEVARTGVGIHLSGGKVSEVQGLEKRLEGGISRLVLSCAVPYWLVGEEVRVVKLEARLPQSVQANLRPWFEFYSAHVEDWRLAAFKIDESWTLDSLSYVSSQDIHPVNDRPESWLLYSPNGRYNLDLYAKDVVLDKDSDGTTLIYALSPDSEVAIEDRLHKNRQRVLFCGTPCRFEAAFWENDQSIIIAGLHQGENKQFHPTIWRIDLNTLQVQQYTYPTPLISPFPHSYVQEVVFGII